MAPSGRHLPKRPSQQQRREALGIKTRSDAPSTSRTDPPTASSSCAVKVPGNVEYEFVSLQHESGISGSRARLNYPTRYLDRNRPTSLHRSRATGNRRPGAPLEHSRYGGRRYPKGGDGYDEREGSPRESNSRDQHLDGISSKKIAGSSRTAFPSSHRYESGRSGTAEGTSTDGEGRMRDHRRGGKRVRDDDTDLSRNLIPTQPPRRGNNATASDSDEEGMQTITAAHTEPRVTKPIPKRLLKAKLPLGWHSLCFEQFTDRFGHKSVKPARMGVAHVHELGEADQDLKKALVSLGKQRAVDGLAAGHEVPAADMPVPPRAIPVDANVEPHFPGDRPPTTSAMFELGPGCALAERERAFQEQCRLIPCMAKPALIELVVKSKPTVEKRAPISKRERFVRHQGQAQPSTPPIAAGKTALLVSELEEGEVVEGSAVPSAAAASSAVGWSALPRSEEAEPADVATPSTVAAEMTFNSGFQWKGGCLLRLPAAVVMDLIDKYITRPWYYEIYQAIARSGSTAPYYQQAIHQLKEDTETLKALALVSRKVNAWTMHAVLKDARLIGATGRDLLLNTRRSLLAEVCNLTVREHRRGARHATLLPSLFIKGLSSSLFIKLYSLDISSCSKDLPDLLAKASGISLPTVTKLSTNIRQLAKPGFRDWINSLEGLRVLRVIDQQPASLAASVYAKAGPPPTLLDELPLPLPELPPVIPGRYVEPYMSWDALPKVPSVYAASLSALTCAQLTELQIGCREDRAMDALQMAIILAPNITKFSLDLWIKACDRAEFWPDFARRYLKSFKSLKNLSIKITQVDEVGQGRVFKAVITANTLKRMVELFALQLPSFERLDYSLRLPLRDESAWVNRARDNAGIVNAIEDRITVTWPQVEERNESKCLPTVVTTSAGALDLKVRRSALNLNRADLGGEIGEGAHNEGALIEHSARRRGISESYDRAQITLRAELLKHIMRHGNDFLAHPIPVRTTE